MSKIKIICIVLLIPTIIILNKIVLAEGKGSTPNGKPFAELNESINNIQNQIDALIGRVDTIENRLTADESAIEDLLVANSALQAQIDANTDDIAGLQAQIDNNNLLIQGLNDEIDQINELLKLKQNIVDGKCPSGSSIREIMEDGSVVCEHDDIGGGGSGSLLYLTTFHSVSVSGGAVGSVTASCPLEYIATGGGFIAHNMNVYQSFPSISQGDYGWYVKAYNGNAYGSSLYAYAVCIKLGP